MTTPWDNDFLSFAALLDIEDKAGQRIKLQPTPALTEFEQARTGRDYVLKARQVYFTTWELARDIWYFITKPSEVVVACQWSGDRRAEAQLSRNISTMLDGLKNTHPEIEFQQRSKGVWERIHRNSRRSCLRLGGVGDPSYEKRGKCSTIDRLHIAEAAFLSYTNDMISLLSCVPLPDAQSEVTIESSPNGCDDFQEAYQNAKSGKIEFKAHCIPWFKHPAYIGKIEGGDVIACSSREKELVTTHNISMGQLRWYHDKVNDPASGGQSRVDQDYLSDDVTCWGSLSG